MEAKVSKSEKVSFLRLCFGAESEEEDDDDEDGIGGKAWC